MTQLTPADLPAYVRQVAPSYGLDPAAVLAMSQHEGISGNPGDGNSSFGPWQLHVGGALPSSIGALGPVAAQQWAWSTDGINYALEAMSGNARNLSGYNAVAAIANWERSADIPGQTARAWSSYSSWVSGIPIALNNFFQVIFPNGTKQKIGGDGQTQPDPGGNAIVPVPPIPIPSDPSIPAPPTGGTSNPQDVRLGQIGPFKVGIPSGLVLGLLGLSFLLIGAMLFVYGNKVSSTVKVGTVGGVRQGSIRIGSPPAEQLRAARVSAYRTGFRHGMQS
jgi:hypothetical protein